MLALFILVAWALSSIIETAILVSLAYLGFRIVQRIRSLKPSLLCGVHDTAVMMIRIKRLPDLSCNDTLTV